MMLSLKWKMCIHHEVGGCRGGDLAMQAHQRRFRTGVTRESPSQIQNNWLDEGHIEDLGKILIKDQSKPADDDRTQNQFAVLYLSSSKKDLLERNFTRKNPEANILGNVTIARKIFSLTMSCVTMSLPDPTMGSMQKNSL